MKLAIIFLATLPAFGQVMAGFSSSFSKGPDGASHGTANFNIAPHIPPAITNAPYAGELVTETVQTLADGTHITHTNLGPGQKTWRDSQGRVRTERRIGPQDDPNAASRISEISDPVTGYVYVLDNINRVAHRIQAIDNPRPPAMPNAATPPPAGGSVGWIGGSVRTMSSSAGAGGGVGAGGRG